MAMTQGEKQAYARGYNNAKGWPIHRPPIPPEPLVARLMEASRHVRDGFDTMQAWLDPDDEWAVKMHAMIDELDAAHTAIGEWLRRPPAHGGEGSG